MNDVRSACGFLILVSLCGWLGGCDAIESLNEDGNGNVTEQQPVELQTGQVASAPPVDRTDAIREMLIGPPAGEWPDPLPVLEWKTSLEAGWKEVRKVERPLLILLRCPGASRSGTLDERLLSPIPELSERLRQFVTVELTDGQDIDLERMPFARYQDPDQTWWCWVLSPEGQVYSVLGSENRNSPEITEAEVSNWLSRVLDHHWDPRRPKWNADGPVIPAETPARSIVQSPGFDRWRKGAEYLGTLRNNGECMCCHQVQDTLWVEEDLKREFRVTEDFWLWPPPANTGLNFESEATPLVTDLSPGSFAEKVRFQSGCTIGVTDEKRVFSTTDVRAAINTLRGPSGLKTYAALNGSVIPSALGITNGAARDYDLTWRTTIAESVLAGHPGFLPARVSRRLRKDLKLENRLALMPNVITSGSPAWERGVRPNQVITQLGEITRDLTPEEFLFLFTLNHQVGSQARLTVRREDARWQPAQFEIPSISVLEIPPEMLRVEAE